VVSGGADSVMLRCDITVTKSGGDYQMHSFSITGGGFRMIDCYHYYSVTGATTDTQLTQSAIEQNGALTTFLLYNSEVTMACDDTNDDLVGFETTTGGAGTYLLTGNIINLQCGAACTSATGLWLYGTATGATLSRNRITIDCDSTAYGLWVDSTAGGVVVNTRHNEMVITSAGTAASGHTDAGDTWNSAFDKMIATSGYNGTGTTNMVSSQTPGNMTVTGILDVYNISLGAGYPSCNLDTDANGNLICGVDTAAGVGIAVEFTNTGAGGRIDTNSSFGKGLNVTNGSLIVGQGQFMFLGNESRIYHTTNSTIKIDDNLNVTGNITTQELANAAVVKADANGVLIAGTLDVVQNFTCRYPAATVALGNTWNNVSDWYVIAPAAARYRIVASGVAHGTSIDTAGAGTGYQIRLSNNGVPYDYTLRSAWTKHSYWNMFTDEWTADLSENDNITLEAKYYFSGGYSLHVNATHSKPYICLIRLTT
jgi:hypothetical protein